MDNQYLNMLGLSYRAGKCVIGEDPVIKSIQKRQAKLVIYASDTGERTKKRILDKCSTFGVTCISAGQSDELSHAVGHSGRVAFAIMDAGFAAKIETLLT